MDIRIRNILFHRITYPLSIIQFWISEIRRIFKLDLLENETSDEQNFALPFQFILALRITLRSVHDRTNTLYTSVYRHAYIVFLRERTSSVRAPELAVEAKCLQHAIVCNQVQRGWIIANGRLLERYDFFDRWNRSAGRPIPLSIVDRFVIENA